VDADRRSQWLRGVLDLCVLSALSRGESYGYELSQALNAAGLGPIQGGTLYPVLLRLQSTGMVVADWREGPSGPARKYYQITATGLELLGRSVIDWQAFTAGVGSMLREVPTR
jgi:PadR family transcriptional regulator, regulatory protein PadR